MLSLKMISILNYLLPILYQLYYIILSFIKNNLFKTLYITSLD